MFWYREVGGVLVMMILQTIGNIFTRVQAQFHILAEIIT